MTNTGWQPRDQRTAAAVDRAANKRRHRASCRCIWCIGAEQYAAITVRIRADNDAKVFPEDLRPRRVT